MADIEKLATDAPVVAYTADEKVTLDDKETTAHVEVMEGKGEIELDVLRAEAIRAEEAERSLGLIGSLKEYPTAAFWSFAISLFISG